MTLLSWRSEYEVGVPAIDSDHQHIFVLINEFHDRHVDGDPRVEVTRVLNQLVKYAEEHFQREEALMSKHAYPRLQNQHELHEGLYASLFELNEQLSRDDVRINARTMRFLKGWLIEHIVNEDMEIGVFLRRQAVLAQKAAQEKAASEGQNDPGKPRDGETRA